MPKQKNRNYGTCIEIAVSFSIFDLSCALVVLSARAKRHKYFRFIFGTVAFAWNSLSPFVLLISFSMTSNIIAILGNFRYLCLRIPSRSFRAPVFANENTEFSFFSPSPAKWHNNKLSETRRQREFACRQPEAIKDGRASFGYRTDAKYGGLRFSWPRTRLSEHVSFSLFEFIESLHFSNFSKRRKFNPKDIATSNPQNNVLGITLLRSTEEPPCTALLTSEHQQMHMFDFELHFNSVFAAEVPPPTPGKIADILDERSAVSSRLYIINEPHFFNYTRLSRDANGTVDRLSSWAITQLFPPQTISTRCQTKRFWKYSSICRRKRWPSARRPRSGSMRLRTTRACGSAGICTASKWPRTYFEKCLHTELESLWCLASRYLITQSLIELSAD